MPGSLTVGLLGIAGNLLGSLNRSKPTDEFEAVKIIDANDPIRLTLKLFLEKGVPSETELVLTDGTMLVLHEVLELGYAAARIKISWPKMTYEYGRAYPGMVEKKLEELIPGAATVRYLAVAFIRQAAP